MLAGIGSEYLLEVGAADSQHYLVGMEELSLPCIWMILMEH